MKNRHQTKIPEAYPKDPRLLSILDYDLITEEFLPLTSFCVEGQERVTFESNAPPSPHLKVIRVAPEGLQNKASIFRCSSA